MFNLYCKKSNEKKKKEFDEIYRMDFIDYFVKMTKVLFHNVCWLLNCVMNDVHVGILAIDMVYLL